MTRTRRSLVVALVGGAAALALTACRGGQGSESARANQGPVPVPVVAGPVVRKTVPLTLRAIGRVEPISTVAVRARVAGELTRAWFTEGESVRKGQTLFTIDPRPYQAVMAEAEARLARNEALLKKAEADASRYAGLVQQDYVTKEQYDQVVTNVAALKAQITADEATIETARLNLSFCTISAPVAGRTGTLLIKAGNLIRPNDERTLVTINQTSPIYVTFTLPAQYLAQVQGRTRNGLEVTAFAPERPDDRHTGTLTFIDNAVDVATNTIQLRGTFGNQDEALWPGQFVSVVLNLGNEPDRVVAPAAAVQTSQQGQYVFVIAADGTTTQQLVTVERQDDTDAVIASGLTGGETVVVEGHLRVVPGGRVRVTTPGAAQPATRTAPAGEAAR